MPLTKPKAAQINFDITNIADPLFSINSGQSGSNDKDSGIVIERGSDTNVGIIWDESTDRFSFINTAETGTTSGNVTISSYADVIANAFHGDLISTSGDITIDSQNSDSDIIFKGTDGGSDITALTLDMSNSGDAYFNNNLRVPGYIWNTGDDNTLLMGGVQFEIALRHVHNTGMKLTNSDSTAVELQFVDSNEAIGSDGTNLILTSGGNEITVPNSGADTMTLNAATQTLTNKTLTSPTITNATVSGNLIAEDGYVGFGDNSADNWGRVAYISGDPTGFNAQFNNAVSLDNQQGSTNQQIYLLDTSAGNTADLLGLAAGGVPILSINGQGDIKFMRPNGSTSYDITLATPTPTAARTITLPDATGTIALTSDITASGISNVSEDSTPQLGGDLDAQSNQITAVSKLEVTNTSTDDSILITSTEDSSTAAPVLTFKRNSGSPADADYLGQLKFKGENDADQEIVYAKITAKILDASDSSEDGLIEFMCKKAGSNEIVARLRSDSLQLLNSTSLTVDGTIEGALVDGDGDTKIQLEESSDDDTIRFDAAGNYVACIESTGVDIKGSYTLTLGGILDANGQRLTNLGAPTSSTDAATKTYVDTELSALSSSSISQGNSSVAVSDSGTGSVAVTIDGSTHTTFNSSGVTLATGVFSGTATSAQYADLAERYTSDQQYEPGTVVELGGEQEVTQTTRPTSCTIAGVVSTNPAYLMNKDLENAVDVALIGRVPCKVVGPVRKGEFLVSSRTPGHAEAHKDLHGPPAGSAIGKAIESKETDGPGVIEVLVGRM
tara:strand:- start:11246 stop:13606 length:2361 start_codon:yes stop_codon:yes gene_type:complete